MQALIVHFLLSLLSIFYLHMPPQTSYVYLKEVRSRSIPLTATVRTATVR